MNLDSVFVVIPALNEELALPRVLADLPPVGRVIVVDNGSRDGTARVAAEAGAMVVREDQRGYGAACLRGLRAVAAIVAAGEPSPSVIVFVDGDHSDHADLLPRLVAPILADEADFVLGSRMLGEREPGALPAQSQFGNWLASTLMRWIFGAHYTDLGPFRAISLSKLRKLGMQDRNYGWTVEMQIKALRRGLRVMEIPVRYGLRVAEENKVSGNLRASVMAGGKILWVVARSALGALR